jgi:CRP/FNR family transcriptional regulator, cyclic AMP receptor protein
MAIAASHLGRVPPAALMALLDACTRLRVPAGGIVRQAGDAGPYLLLVVYGLIRIFLVAPDGRTLTIRYCRRGALIGTVSLFPESYVLGATAQAVTDGDVLTIRPAVVQRLVETDPAVARALLGDLSERVIRFVAEIPGSMFATVRQRVARHLLDLAADRPAGRRLVATVSQQELADAVGTAREVVARVLRDMREEGLVATRRGGIVILEPDRLGGELFTRPTDRALGPVTTG